MTHAAETDQPLNEVCKSECPKAKDEAEAMKCLKYIVAKKKDDKKFRKSDCYAAFKEHSAHEREDGHSD